MTIELKSDMCCGTGEANGVSVDQVTALDLYGLPVIPAKRIKGILREEAERIAAIAPKGAVASLFGKPGDQESGKLSFEQAHLAGCEDIEAHIHSSAGRLTPGVVSDVYTVTRTTTSVAEDGVADDHTLRTTQLVRHCDSAGESTRFVCKVVGTDLGEEEKAFFDDAVRCLRAVGLNRSRGMGEVVCSGSWEDKDEGAANGVGKNAVSKTRLGYRITLHGPAIIQSGAGESLDYIPGSMVQGMLAQCFAKSDPRFFAQHVLRDSRFGNAYVDIEGSSVATLSTPVPFTHRTQKNAESVKNPETGMDEYPLYDSSILAQSGPDGAVVQQVPIAGYGAVVNGDYRVASVDQSLSFHSSKETSEQGKQYYSLQSMDAGQSFAGIIEASSDAIVRFAAVFGQHERRFRVGGDSSAGFGACSVQTFDVGEAGTIAVKNSDRIAIRFESDVVFVDDKGTNTTDVDAFVRWLATDGRLGFDFEVSTAKPFVKTCVVGGYNTHWRLPKRQFVAFKKGSVIVVSVSAPEAKTVLAEAWVGQLKVEGFGKLALYKVAADGAKGCYCRVDAKRVSHDGESLGLPSQNAAASSKYLLSFKHDLALNDATERAVLAACKRGDKYPLGASSKSSFMRIGSVFWSACKTSDEGNLRQRFASLAKDVLADENTLLAACGDLDASCKELLEGYPVLSKSGKDLVFKRFVLSYLHQVKVRYSTKKGDAHE